MKSLYLSFLLFSFASVVVAQPGATIQMDTNQYRIRKIARDIPYDGWSFIREYYLSGKLKAEYYYRKMLIDGRMQDWHDSTYTGYHENGKRSVSGTHSNGNRSGTWSYYSRRGRLIDERVFVNGTEQINIDDEDAAFCGCSYTDDCNSQLRPHHFVNRLDDIVSGFTDPDAGYGSPIDMHLRSMAAPFSCDSGLHNMYVAKSYASRDDLSLEFLSFFDHLKFSIRGNYNYKLNLTPCRRGSNCQYIKARAWYGYTGNKIRSGGVMIDIPFVSLEFPPAFLQPYDTLRNKIYKQKGGYTSVKALYSLKQLIYRQPGGNDMPWEIEFEDLSQQCLPPFMLQHTGVVIIPGKESQLLPLNKRAIGYGHYPFHQKRIRLVDGMAPISFQNDAYLDSFLGISLKQASLYIPKTKQKYILQDILLDDTELNATILTKAQDTKRLKSFLKKKGFELKETPENEYYFSSAKQPSEYLHIRYRLQ